MSPGLGRVHHRILELAVTADESDDDLLVTAVTYYRTRQHLVDGDGETLAFTADAAADPHEIEMGQLLPPATHIRLDATFQA